MAVNGVFIVLGINPKPIPHPVSVSLCHDAAECFLRIYLADRNDKISRGQGHAQFYQSYSEVLGYLCYNDEVFFYHYLTKMPNDLGSHLCIPDFFFKI